MLVYDVNQQSSFDSLASKWHPMVKQYSDDALVVIVGNKRDTPDDQPTVPTKVAKEYASSISAEFFETSAKSPGSTGLGHVLEPSAAKHADDVALRALDAAITELADRTIGHMSRGWYPEFHRERERSLKLSKPGHKTSCC